jgi:hypothetical protein
MRVIGMDGEQTLLQQIRQKEQEYAAKIETVKSDTSLAVEAAKNEAEAQLCTVDAAAKAEAERLYWEGKGKIEAEIEELKRRAAAEQEAAAATGERNLKKAVDAITRSVTMQ